jgi:hypothetical protein
MYRKEIFEVLKMHTTTTEMYIGTQSYSFNGYLCVPNCVFYLIPTAKLG